ncbi:hypothetical protein ABFS83_14G285500 [Erythranthe nasuta]
MAWKGALRQLASSSAKSAGRNSSGRITIFHRGGGAKRLQRTIDLNRSTAAMGIVERIEYDPNRSSRIALVRWEGGIHHKRKGFKEEPDLPAILESTTTTATIRGGPFAFSSLPTNRSPPSDWSKKTTVKDVLSSAFSSPKAKGETFGNFPRIVVAGAKAPFFVFRKREEIMREKDGGENTGTFSLSEIQKWRSGSTVWAHRMKRQAALSWPSFVKREEILANQSKKKPITDKALPSKPDRANVTYIIASHQMEAGKMVMNWSKPSE